GSTIIGARCSIVGNGGNGGSRADRGSADPYPTARRVCRRATPATLAETDGRRAPARSHAQRNAAFSGQLTEKIRRARNEGDSLWQPCLPVYGRLADPERSIRHPLCRRTFARFDSDQAATDLGEAGGKRMLPIAAVLPTKRRQ